jgi:transcriptional regulator with XRE-family HTH domain
MRTTAITRTEHVRGLGPVSLGVALSLLRIISGLNQKELAESSGIRSSSISDYEQGRKMPELSTLQRLLAPMGLTLAALDHARVFMHQVRLEPLPEEMEPGAEARRIALEAGQVASRLTMVLLGIVRRQRAGEGAR